ncbi:MAG: HXXEE domain-containing protein [Deltaproteobacteria bacterium]
MTRFQSTFLALVAVQAAHSVEECVGRLYDVFPPARFVSGLISHDHARGFILGNVALVALGLYCFLGPVRRQWPSAVPLAWLWVVIELVNGVTHSLWSLARLRYTPGVATAPLLLALAVYLARQLLAGRAAPSAAT